MGPCGVVQSVELLLDVDLEDRILVEWRALEAAGLPSQARHTAPSNRPHVTVVAADRIDPASEPAVAAGGTGVLALPGRGGAVRVFGRGAVGRSKVLTRSNNDTGPAGAARFGGGGY